MSARSYSVTRSIGAPAATAWSLLTDADSYAAWNRAVVSIRGPIAPGGKVALVSAVDPKRTFTLQVTEMRPPNHMVWSGGMPLGLFKGVRTYELADDGSQRCTFTMTETFSGALAGLITKSMPDLTDSFALFADGLKAAAEAQMGR